MVEPRKVVLMVVARSIWMFQLFSSGSTPPSALNIEFRRKPVAIFCCWVAFGSMSPAICSRANWLNGMLRFSAWMTQSRYGHMVRRESFS